MPGILSMSEPKYRYEKPPIIRYGYPPQKALHYEITDRLQQIATPWAKKYDDTPYDYTYISPSALKYKRK